MLERLTNRHAFAALDDDTGMILAFGETAASAVLAADEIAPEATIYVINLGEIGPKVSRWWHAVVPALQPAAGRA